MTEQFDREAFIQFILDSEVFGLFEEPVTLKSGRKTNFYANWRAIASDTFGIDVLSDFVLDFVQDLRAQRLIDRDPVCFLGVPEGATKLGVITQYKFALRSPVFGPNSHPMPMGRSTQKSHGVPEDRFFVGAPKGPTILIEDVTTTGGSLLEFLDSLLDAKCDVLACIGLTNRMEKRDDGHSVEDAVKARKRLDGRPVPYFYMSSALDLLPEIVRRKKPSLQLTRMIEQEFQEFGTSSIQLLDS